MSVSMGRVIGLKLKDSKITESEPCVKSQEHFIASVK